MSAAVSFMALVVETPVGLAVDASAVKEAMQLPAEDELSTSYAQQMDVLGLTSEVRDVLALFAKHGRCSVRTSTN